MSVIRSDGLTRVASTVRRARKGNGRAVMARPSTEADMAKKPTPDIAKRPGHQMVDGKPRKTVKKGK